MHSTPRDDIEPEELRHAQCHEAAEYLLAARRSGQTMARLPLACRPTDSASALTIQSLVGAGLGESAGAWKCGLPAAGSVAVASVHASSVHRTSPLVLDTGGKPARVEPELAFIIGRDLPPRLQPYSEAEKRAAIAETRLALELIGSRYDDDRNVSPPEALADGLANKGLYLGPVVAGALERDLEHIDISIQGPDGQMHTIAGRHPASDPLLPYFWLVDFLSQRGLGLCAGQAVITGSYAGCLKLQLSTPWKINYAGLGALDVRIEPA